MNKSIGLALSGGGVRAAAFHAGVLQYLAERELLEDVSHVSSVSGGSLFTGLVFKNCQYTWPTSQEYLDVVLPSIRTTLTTTSLQLSAILRLVLNPLNWRFAISRANVLALAINKLWGIERSLGNLPLTPVWSINCTTGETGRRFRFKDATLGDYELGYAKANDFCVSRAMAVSAAFPGGIGPLAIKTQHFAWEKSKEWDNRKPEPHKPPFRTLHLYDGGLYDNLGLEPLFDVGRQMFKDDNLRPTNVDFLVVSDGGAPLPQQGIPHPLSLSRFKRMADIALDQNRRLRVRSLMNFLETSPSTGVYLGIGTAAKPAISKLSKSNPSKSMKLLNDSWLDHSDAQRAANYGTTLRQLSCETFELIARHGYETAKWTFELSMPSVPVNAIAKPAGNIAQ